MATICPKNRLQYNHHYIFISDKLDNYYRKAKAK